MFKRLIAIIYMLFMAASSAVFFIVCLAVWLLTVLLDRRLVMLHWLTCLWGTLYVWLLPFWDVKIEDKQKFATDRTYVVVANHQSQLDILISFGLFRHFKWVSKAEIFLVPFIGWNMALNRYIRLRRGEADSVRRMYKDCADTLKSGSSIFMFPEGTRALGGEPGAFKPGAFIMAKNAGVAILPIAIYGTRDALPKKSMNYHGRHRMVIRVLDEISAAEVQRTDTKVLADQVRQRIFDALVDIDQDQQQG
jgi:1-acyl-sn-glycerol-3-phosphate acyltransferase